MASSFLSQPSVDDAVTARPADAGAKECPRLPFDQTAAAILKALQQALADLLAAAPVEIRKSMDVERVFGVHHQLGWQTYRLAHAKNPLAAGVHVPARVSLTKLLAAAGRLNIPAPIIDRVSQAFEAFEHLAHADAGDREALQAMLNAFIPEERAKQELASKQMVFKGMSQLKGITAEADLQLTLYAPSASPGKLDLVALTAEFGIRRTRPDARLLIGAGSMVRAYSWLQTLDGSPVTDPLAMLLPQFSTTPLPTFNINYTGGAGGLVQYVATGQDVGMRSALDLVSAHREKESPSLIWTEGPAVRGPTCTMDTPVKRLTIDVYVHHDVYPGVTPVPRVYDTSMSGAVRQFDDPSREQDRVSTHDVIRAWPEGVEPSLPHVPRYREMVKYLFDTLGWNPAQFRCFRMDVEYPMYAAQYIMGFRLPGAP